MSRPAGDWTRRVFWLGGASGAGKSTVARRLAAAHGMTVYATDDVMADHARRCAPPDCPQLETFRRMSMDERWIERSPQVMLDTFHWFRGEAFAPILEDLAVVAQDRCVIAEGFRLLPRLVQPVLAAPRQALWLIPTAAFRRTAFTARGTLWDIAGKTSRPEVALRNLLERDRLFAERLKTETARLGLPSLGVDGSSTEDELLAAVESRFMIPALRHRARTNTS